MVLIFSKKLCTIVPLHTLFCTRSRTIHSCLSNKHCFVVADVAVRLIAKGCISATLRLPSNLIDNVKNDDYGDENCNFTFFINIIHIYSCATSQLYVSCE